MASAISQQTNFFCRSASLQEVYYHQAKLPRCMQTTLCSSPTAARSSPAWLYALACFTEGPDDGSGGARSSAAVQLGQQYMVMVHDRVKALLLRMHEVGITYTQTPCWWGYTSHDGA